MRTFFNALQSNRRGNAVIPTPVGSSNPFVFEATDYIHIITNGQSLSNGAETTPRLSLTQIGDNQMIGDSDRIDITTNTTQFNPLIGLSTQAEAIAAPLANALKSKLASALPSHPLNNQTFVATNTGTGGRTVTQLTGVDYPKFTNAITAGKNIVDGLGKTISCPFIVYMQGETENSGSVATYKTNLIAHFNKMRNDVQAMYGQANLPTIIVYQPKDPDEPYVRQVYYELASEYDWIVQAGNVYSVPNRGIHLDSNGSRWYGEMLAKAVFQSIQSGNKFQPLQPTNIEIIGSDVIITYNRDVVFDEISRPGTASNLKGFQLTNNIQQSIAIQNGNQVVITTNQSNLSTYIPLGVVYGKGYLRDTDGYLATTNYEDYVFDGGNPVDNQTYNSEGNIIYGQKYPMWNWSIQYLIYIQ